MELFALAAAYCLMRVTGHLGPLVGPDGLVRGTGVPSTGGPTARRPTSPGRPRRVQPGVTPRLADRVADRWAGWTDRTRDRLHTELDRRDHDRGHIDRARGMDERTRWQRRRDRLGTCPRCGHGGRAPAAPGCDCTYEGPRGWPCQCPYVSPTAPTAPADDVQPTARPVPNTQPEGDPVMTAPPAPSVPAPTGPPGPPTTAGPGRPAVPGGGGVGAAEFTLRDLIDMVTRVCGQLDYAADQMSAGRLGARTVGGVAELREHAAMFKARLIADHGQVLQAVQDAPAVGEMDRYIAR